MNYLALIGWSPGGDEELLPVDELARRFSLEDVGHSAGVFDEEKLAWVNRHYLKDGAIRRGSRASSLPYFATAGFVARPGPTRRRRTSRRSCRWRPARSIGSTQVPARLAFLFEFDPARGARATRRGRRCCAHDGRARR